MDQNADVTITIRVPQDLLDFIDDQARTLCNTRSGIARFALTKFMEAATSGVGAANPVGQPEEAAA